MKSEPRIEVRRIDIMEGILNRTFWLDTVGRNVVPEEDMTESEIEAYMEGWRNEEDRN